MPLHLPIPPQINRSIVERPGTCGGLAGERQAVRRSRVGSWEGPRSDTVDVRSRADADVLAAFVPSDASRRCTRRGFGGRQRRHRRGIAWGQGEIGGRNRRRRQRGLFVRAVEPAIAADEAAKICLQPRGAAGLRAPVYHRPATTASPLNGRPFDGHSKRGNDRGGGHVHQRSVFGFGRAGGDGRWLLRKIRVERARRHEFRVSARAGRRNGSRPEGASTESGVTGAPSNQPLQRTKPRKSPENLEVHRGSARRCIIDPQLRLRR